MNKELKIEATSKMVGVSQELRNSEILQEIILEVYGGWGGKEGEKRVLEVLIFISERIPQYAKVVGKTDLDFLILYANARRVNYNNWFSDTYLPDLDTVFVFDTIDDFKTKFPSGKYICPSCEGESTDFQTCNSGLRNTGQKCNWRSYGLFGTLGKGIKIYIKDMVTDFPKPIEIFMPIELYKQAQPQA